VIICFFDQFLRKYFCKKVDGWDFLENQTSKSNWENSVHKWDSWGKNLSLDIECKPGFVDLGHKNKYFEALEIKKWL
jgi:hypothetical protein